MLIRKPLCISVPHEPERRLALARWIKHHRANGNIVTRPSRCKIDVCPRHGTKTPVPHVGPGFVIYESIGYGIITKAARKLFERMPDARP